MNHLSLRLFLCPGCGTGAAFDETPGQYVCPGCRYISSYPSSERFGEQEWDADRRLGAVLGCLLATGGQPSERKSRLLLVAVGRNAFGRYRRAWFVRAMECAERWADDGTAQFGVDAIRRRLGRQRTGSATSREATLLAIDALSTDLSGNGNGFGEDVRPAFVGAYRELFANPFIPLTWNAAWFTSTVRDLAQHIYTAHDFGAMSVLADVLQDAGCDDEQVLTHCRTNRPHARGCWVLDAVLGKS